MGNCCGTDAAAEDVVPTASIVTEEISIIVRKIEPKEWMPTSGTAFVSNASWSPKVPEPLIKKATESKPSSPKRAEPSKPAVENETGERLKKISDDTVKAVFSPLAVLGNVGKQLSNSQLLASLPSNNRNAGETSPSETKRRPARAKAVALDPAVWVTPAGSAFVTHANWPQQSSAS